jgi:hypothetical protein
MVMDVEIELQIPTLLLDEGGDAPRRIDNRHVRFRRVIEVPTFPVPGSTVRLSAGLDLSFDCLVSRAFWEEGNQRFLVPCKYPKHRILPGDYLALVSDPAWQKRTLETQRSGAPRSTQE